MSKHILCDVCGEERQHMGTFLYEASFNLLPKQNDICYLCVKKIVEAIRAKRVN
jgi:hypothetical protein